MKNVTPSFEVIVPSFGSSFTYTSYTEKANNKSDIWHYHPEIELVYVNGGSGKRQIGSHLSYYTDGDLILIGSNLPHCGFTNEETGNTIETVIQMKPDFLGEGFFGIVEMKKVKNLLQQARIGIAFEKETKNRVGSQIELMQKMNPLDRLLSFLKILNDLAHSKDSIFLNADGFSIVTQMQDNDKINLVFNYVKNHYFEPIALEQVADLVSMTVPSFCRFFKKITNKTFTTFVNEYRLVHACKLLAEKPISITEICFESGFNNFSHFNKLFKEYTGKSASQYRNELKNILK
ncbi:MAG: AraC family transcriptional regulator [Flavobacterium sp.]|uniref:AraC family transcriptional regulator n=1 Tax=unclassified Flavobacterium TaxID=196869 RepID=UPI000C5AF81D|nr:MULTISPECIES: AraC family transcriptional regulator [unclassified Flavobacterium]MBF02221.1 AraC family transcriptional regulator [Flavobacterium sp.]MCO6163248.1 AraC family transcriptional regulator [Flavobacterium sp. NRK F7]|tara:strand:- start:1080 stop:1952 length:873 start_codon:yes stop_codon:yes gene_type:complete